MRYYKLLVQAFRPNVEREPLRNPDGSAQTETYRANEERVESIPVNDAHGQPLKKEDGTTVLRQVFLQDTVLRERPIIPDHVVAREYSIYQEVDSDGVAPGRYFDEEGKEFLFTDASHHEINIVDTNSHTSWAETQ